MTVHIDPSVRPSQAVSDINRTAFQRVRRADRRKRRADTRSPETERPKAITDVSMVELVRTAVQGEPAGTAVGAAMRRALGWEE